MRVVYDCTTPGMPLLYIHVRELADGEHVARTVEIDDSVNVDLDAGGKLTGIEVLSPGANWPLHRILRDYEISDRDAAMLMAGYPHRAPVKAESPLSVIN